MSGECLSRWSCRSCFGEAQASRLAADDSLSFSSSLDNGVAKELMDFPEAAFLVEGRVVEIVQPDAEAGWRCDRECRSWLLRAMDGGFLTQDGLAGGLAAAEAGLPPAEVIEQAQLSPDGQRGQRTAVLAFAFEDAGGVEGHRREAS